jgi:hypothetical protein
MRRRGVRILTVTGIGVAAVATAGALAATAGASPQPGYPGYSVQQVLSGANLRHANSHTGKNEALSQPAAITEAGGAVYAAFDNGVGTKGQASASGNADSTIVQFTPGGTVTWQGDVAGQVSGLAANPDTGEIVVTANSAGHAVIYTIDGGSVTRYTFSKALPSNGGVAGATFYKGQLVVTASAPGSTGHPAPQAAYPTAYVVTLNQGTATATPYFYDESPAQVANGGPAGSPLGRSVTLGLTDPVTAAVVPGQSFRWRGALVVTSEADQQLIYSPEPGSLWTLRLAHPVADTAFATSWRGALFATDPAANAVDEIGWQRFWPGTEFLSVVPCAAHNAAHNCQHGYLARLNMMTGELIPVQVGGSPIQPSRLVFLPM